MNDQALWETMRAAWAAIGPYYEPVIEQFVEQTGLDHRAWGLLLAALSFEPETISPAHLLVRGPYTSPEKYLERLQSLAGEGYLVETEPGEFRLSPSGAQETRRFIQEVRAAMAKADPLTGAQGLKLGKVLDTLVRSCLNAPPPPDTWSIRHCFQLMPDMQPPLPYIEQAFSCLAAYRDDAHLASWQESGLTATALEVLTFLWRGQANSLDSLVEHLAQRGHTRRVYSDSLAVLRSRKLVAGSKSDLHLTDDGKRLRDQVEAETDRLFYAPWSVLNPADKKEITQLLTLLKDGLKVKEEST